MIRRWHFFVTEAHIPELTGLFTACHFLKRIFLFGTSIGQRKSKVKGRDTYRRGRPLFDSYLAACQDLTPFPSQYAGDQGRARRDLRSAALEVEGPLAHS